MVTREPVTWRLSENRYAHIFCAKGHYWRCTKCCCDTSVIIDIQIQERIYMGICPLCEVRELNKEQGQCQTNLIPEAKKVSDA